MRILLVEDDWTSREMLRMTLERMGHEVVVAENGRDAWRLHKLTPFPFILTDWMMPEMTGLELCKRVRARQAGSYTFIMLLTARTDRESLLEAFDAGVDDFLAKPFDSAELLARIRSGERLVHLKEDLAGRIEELALANERMKRDLLAAAEIQTALLPVAAPAIAGARFAWRLVPCEELAGDILNVFPIDEHRAAVYLLDVSGHGVASALMSVTLSRILSRVPGQSFLLAEEHEDPDELAASPARVLQRLNARFQIGESSIAQYFTIVYGVLDVARREFRYAQAGHPPILRTSRKASPVFLPAGGFPVGFVPDADYTDSILTLEPGDRLFLYSDGIVEATNRHQKLYGPDRLMVLADATDGNDLPGAVEQIVGAACRWEGDHLRDDMSMVAIEFVGDDGSTGG
ncbi:MAG: SpoIIE family protein phosphatase [Candidatus Sumerlaeia bacterium]|nr:SpoIIE family protein phosphatase [Candidatus Sumerlaeia bacterium]